MQALTFQPGLGFGFNMQKMSFVNVEVCRVSEFVSANKRIYMRACKCAALDMNG